MKVSVVVIVRNAEKTIAKCLSSIIEQSHPPHEIIVVDGQSTDRTREIASQFPVKLIIAPARHTYGSSRNLGVKTATGDVIAFLDADDSADEKWLENVERAFSSANVGIINSKRVYVYPSNWFTDLKWDKMQEKKQSYGLLGREQPEWKEFATSGGAFRKELIEEAGYFDEDMFFDTEDKDLAKRIFDMGYDIAFEPDAIVYFRPASSVREWLKDAFYRHGLGHGTISRRYGGYHPSLGTPIATMLIFLCFLISFMFSYWQLIPLLLTLLILGIAIRTYKLFRKTKKLLHSLVYIIYEILARNLEFLGFTIGYIVSPRVLRKIVRR